MCDTVSLLIDRMDRLKPYDIQIPPGIFVVFPYDQLMGTLNFLKRFRHVEALVQETERWILSHG